MKLDPTDLEITSFGAGWESHSFIRIKHIPTGITVESDSERSQYYNRKKCLEILEKKLEEIDK